jgi:hypothetical protein
MSDLAVQLEDYGCGLAAAFSKFLTQRTMAPMLLRRAPAALRALLASDSSKNEQRSASYPAELSRAEWRGLRAGPMAYRRSRKRARRIDRLEAK